MIRLINRMSTYVTVKPVTLKPFGINAKSSSEPIPETEVSESIKGQISKGILRMEETPAKKVKLQKVVPPETGLEGDDK